MLFTSLRRPSSSAAPRGRTRLDGVDTANVYFDHPYHAPLDHALGIDFICEADGGRERVAVELSRKSALELIETIKAALASGDVAHAKSVQAKAVAARPTLVGSQTEMANLFLGGDRRTARNSRGCVAGHGELVAGVQLVADRAEDAARHSSRPRSACRD